MNSRSEVHHANHYTIEASYKKGQIFHVESYNVLLFCEVKIEMPVTYNEWILELNVKIKNLGIQFEVEDSLDSIPSPPPSVKIQIIGGKVY
jgi:hypothetical protein